jgi:glycine reductase
MSTDNPAVELYRAKTTIVPTTSTATGMSEALGKMARLAAKLAQGQLGPAHLEGYIPKGLRFTEIVSEPVGKRAVEMLMLRLRDEPVHTEWAVPQYGRVTPAPPLHDLTSATIALITSGGIVPKGNPHRLESARATKWVKYNIAEVHALMAQEWESIHGGYDTTNANQEPNRVLPLDMLKALKDEGVIGRLFDDVYVTTGNQAGLEHARRFGQEIGEELLAGGVDGVLLVAT